MDTLNQLHHDVVQECVAAYEKARVCVHAVASKPNPLRVAPRCSSLHLPHDATCSAAAMGSPL